MFKRTINRIIIFFTLLFGFDIPRTKDKYQESTPTVSISKEQQQEEIHKFLTEECIAWDPTSPEAKAEMKIVDDMIGDFGEDSFYEIEPGNDKLRNTLIGKTKS